MVRNVPSIALAWTKVAVRRMEAEMRAYYVTAFGWWFCMARGWVRSPAEALPLTRRSAEVVKQVNPGVTLVEVSA